MQYSLLRRCGCHPHLFQEGGLGNSISLYYTTLDVPKVEVAFPLMSRRWSWHPRHATMIYYTALYFTILWYAILTIYIYICCTLLYYVCISIYIYTHTHTCFPLSLYICIYIYYIPLYVSLSLYLSIYNICVWIFVLRYVGV